MPEFLTNCRPLPFMLRETSRAIRDGRTWALLGVVAAGLALIGPFGTYQVMPLPGRVVYWGLIVVGTFWIASAMSEAMAGILDRTAMGRTLRLVVLQLLLAVPVTGFVAFVALAFGGHLTWAGTILLYAQCLALSVLVALIDRLLAVSEVRQSSAPPALMQRLPPARRGDLVRLSAQGHYVEVITSRGSSLLLMRLNDAIAEAAPEPGLRIHRSHWIARRAVRGTRRIGGKLHLLATDGSALAISRPRIRDVRAAGLLWPLDPAR